MANKLNFFRGEYSKFLELVENSQVVSTNLYFTVPDAEPKADDPKSNSFCVFHGTELLASATHEADLNKVIGDVASLTERINKINDEIATYSISAITPSSENVKEEYVLMKHVGTAITRADETSVKIYKDSALQDVKLSGDSLVFTYLTASGASKTIEVNVSSFLSESEFKNGLSVINGEVSVKLGEDVTDADGNVTSKNFLEFEGTEGQKALAVRSMDTNVTVTTSDIVIAGGPLDNTNIRQALSGGTDDAGNFVIKQGTDIQQLLVSLFTKEEYPKPLPTSAYTKASASAAMNALTIKLDASGDQEVGTLVKLTSGYTNGSKVSNAKSSSITGLTYGWSAADDDKKDSSDTAITSDIKTVLADDKYTISATINSGFNADTVTNKKTTPATVTGTSSAALAETILGCIDEGTNKITINATGASYSYSADSISGGYLVSNVGNTDSAHTYSGVSAVTLTTTPKATGSTNASVTGKFKYFMGYNSGTTVADYNSDIIRALTTKTGWVTKDGTTTIVDANNPLTSNGQSIVIACPQKYSLATITNGVGANILGNFTEKGTVSVKTGSINSTYMVYIYPITNGTKVEFKNLTIKK